MSDLKSELLAKILEEVDLNGTDLDGLLARYPEQREDLLPLLELAQRLNSAPPALPREEFRRVARTRLLSRLPDDQPVTFGLRLRHLWQTSLFNQPRRVAMSWMLIFVTLLGLVAGGSGVAFAATDALPGDMLYSVKSTIEVARLGLADNAGDFDLYLQYTDTRLAELEALIAAGRFEDLPTAAQGFEDSLQNLERLRAQLGPQGYVNGDPLATRLRERLETHARLLQGILGLDEEIIPLQAQQRIRQMIQVVNQVQNYGPPEDPGPHGNGAPDEAGPQGPNAPEGAGPGSGVPPEDAGPPGNGEPDGGQNQGDGAPMDPGQNGQGSGSPQGGGPGDGNSSSGGNGQNGGN